MDAKAGKAKGGRLIAVIGDEVSDI